MELKMYAHLCENVGWEKPDVKFIGDFLVKLDMTINSGCSTKFREIILEHLYRQGWSSKIRLNHGSSISITAIKQKMGLCIQTGNMSRFYADLLKLEYLHKKGTINEAIYIVMTRRNAKVIGSNLVHFERLTDELALFDEIITVPMYVFGID